MQNVSNWTINSKIHSITLTHVDFKINKEAIRGQSLAAKTKEADYDSVLAKTWLDEQAAVRKRTDTNLGPKVVCDDIPLTWGQTATYTQGHSNHYLQQSTRISHHQQSFCFLADTLGDFGAFIASFPSILILHWIR